MEDGFILNIDNGIADKRRPAVIRNLFIDIRDRSYVTPGEFFREMSDRDLDVLREYSEMIGSLEGADPNTKEHDEACENMSLLGLALCVGDGIELTDDTAVNAIQTAVLFTSLEHLARLGVIDVYRDNWSMDPMDNAMIAKAKPEPPVIDLTGPDGNAYALMAYATRFGRQLHLNVEQIHTEMMAGDYENLVQVFDKYFGEYVILRQRSQ